MPEEFSDQADENNCIILRTFLPAGFTDSKDSSPTWRGGMMARDRFSVKTKKVALLALPGATPQVVGYVVIVPILLAR